MLGQYDVFLPPDDEGLIYFVGPNVAEAERRFSLPAADFRLWIALHESDPPACSSARRRGCAGYLAGQDRRLPRHGASWTREQLLEQLRRAIDEVRAGTAPEGR